VAWLGSGIAWADRRLPARSLLTGIVLATIFPALAAGVALVLRSRIRMLPAPVGVAVEAVALKQSFAVRSLFTHAAAVERPLAAGRIEEARAAVSVVDSRPTKYLVAPAVASAGIGSLAESAAGSAVAGWGWEAAGGLPAAFAYRAINTLDAMVGYRERGLAGTPSARLDDALNFVPARLTALAVAAASPRRLAGILVGMRQDAGATPSPNSGWPMAAAAHALGVRLEKEHHHVLNSGGAAPSSADIGRARLLVTRALVIAFVVTIAALWGRGAER
jgi:adenosylcobinamide-phosphate synthase